MVKSGLINNTTVSHFRLSLHLSLAFIIISLIFWNLLNIKDKKIKPFFTNKTINYLFYVLIFLIFIQIIVGAFVSGLDAGLIYQTWPLMDYTYFPNDVVIEKIYDFFNFYDHGLVQFYHRNIAYIILIYILSIGIFIYKKHMIKLFKSYLLVAFFLLLQIVLGIFTLISGLNIFLASVHQICSLLLTLSVFNLYYKYIN
jgi:cytochrome c oxidase assembly protein subunit 15